LHRRIVPTLVGGIFNNMHAFKLLILLAGTYAILIRACISQGQFDQAVGLLRGALGLSGGSPSLSLSPSLAVCHSLDYVLVNEILVSLAEYRQAQEAAVSLLSDIKQQKPRVRIDSSTQRRVMGLCSAIEGSHKGGGKGWNTAKQ